MNIAFLLVLSTVLVGLVSTSPYRKESLLEALMNKIEEKEQAEAESLDAKMQLRRGKWQNVEALLNKIQEKEQAEAESLDAKMQGLHWWRPWGPSPNKIEESLLEALSKEEKEQAEAESLDAKMQLVRRG